MRLGFVELLMPFLFVAMPSVLMLGSPLHILASATLSTIGVVGLTVAFAGWLVRHLHLIERVLIGAGALMVMWPEGVDSMDPMILATRLIGFCVLVFFAFRIFLSRPAVADPSNARNL